MSPLAGVQFPYLQACEDNPSITNCMLGERRLKWNKRFIADCHPVLRPGAGKGWKVMVSKARVTWGPCCHSENIKKAVMMAVVLIMLGLMGAFPSAFAQGFGQNQGGTVQNLGGLSQNPQQNRFPENSPNFPKPTQKQRQALLNYNFKKLKKHVEDLAELTKSLQTEVDKSNENVLSLEIVKKAEEAEKLAKKIKDEAKGY
jgi:hypothetical protein